MISVIADERPPAQPWPTCYCGELVAANKSSGEPRKYCGDLHLEAAGLVLKYDWPLDLAVIRVELQRRAKEIASEISRVTAQALQQGGHW